MSQPAPPIQDPIARPRRAKIPEGQKDPLEGLLTDSWNKWFTDQNSIIANTSATISSVSVDSQTASIGATAMPVGALAPGLYFISYYTTITTAAGVSSSLQVTLSWTDGGVVKQFNGAALTGNTTSENESNYKLILVDSATPVTYATTYASNPAAAMNYKLSVVFQSVG